MPRFPLVMLLAFALTLFTSATLLFLVQPMIGKMILPLLGGTPEVWNTCMVFFQAMLLAGYAYAHATTRWLGVRRQAGLHLVVLLLPILLFAVNSSSGSGPIAINENLIVGGANPILGVLLVLLFSVGLPFFVVSTTSPLLQQWFSSTDHPAAGDPYFLSTASNLGSMLALIGYPVLVEPWLRLGDQRLTWALGYGLYFVLTATCAILLWKSGLAAAEASRGENALAPVSGPTTGITEARSVKVQTGKSQGKGRSKRGAKSERVSQSPAPREEPTRELMLSGTVTVGRRLRWIMLAFVPSSFLMGVTTYMTTDIAAIPLLWVLPLGLYLLSFIIVFAQIPRWVHQAAILAMPLMVLLLIFMMLSEIKPEKITIIVALHLLLMLVVSMVCHGEMVRDRPPTKYLTEFYLLMSVGGVLGGIFNALLAPVIFNSLVEYRLAMVAACLLLPPLVPDDRGEEAGVWGRYVDLTLLSVFALIGFTLIWLRLRDPMSIPFSRLKTGGWGWPLAALLITLAAGTFNILRSRVNRLECGLDLALPVMLLVLTFGLIWGLNSEYLSPRLTTISDWLPLSEKHLRIILTFGVPSVLCYVFVERSLRFGLGVGAILMAGSFSNLFMERTLYEKRSYFGVLKVEVQEDYLLVTGQPLPGIELPNYRLVHGTTLHGKQYLKDQYELPQLLTGAIGTTIGRDVLGGGFNFIAAIDAYDYSVQALTYYHRTGPIGQVMRAFNRSAKDRIGVIGLGTGTLASYGRPGQTIVFYDIDKTVKEISFDRRDYFSFVWDARARGVNVADLVLGDARLEIERYLEKNPKLTEDEKYAVLAVDAFSSDAIPIHLITREAVQLYLRTLREDGVLAFHVSNRYLDLRPVLANIAEKEGLVSYVQSDGEGRNIVIEGNATFVDSATAGKSASTWVLLARKQEYLEFGEEERVDEVGRKSNQKYDRLLTPARWEKEREAARQVLLPIMGAPHSTPLSMYLLEMVSILHDWPPRSKDADVSSEDWPKGSFLKAPWQPLEPKRNVGVWTDDYSNLFKVFSW